MAEPNTDETLLVQRRYALMGLLCDSENFIKKIEKLAGRNLHHKLQGRPKQSNSRW